MTDKGYGRRRSRSEAERRNEAKAEPGGARFLTAVRQSKMAPLYFAFWIMNYCLHKFLESFFDVADKLVFERVTKGDP